MLAKISSQKFVLAYCGHENDGYLATFSVNEAYAITKVAYLEYNIYQGMNNSVCVLNDTHFALAWTDENTYLLLEVFTTPANLSTIARIKSLDTNAIGPNNSLILIGDSHLILASNCGASYRSGIKTLAINGEYAITEIDTLVHDTTNNFTLQENSLAMIDAAHYVLAYSTGGSDGGVKTFSIDEDYDNITELSYLEHDTTNGTHNSIIMIDAFHPVVAYAGPDDDGFVKVFELD